MPLFLYCITQELRSEHNNNICGLSNERIIMNFSKFIIVLILFSFHVYAKKFDWQQYIDFLVTESEIRHPDMDRNVSELITSKGYPVEIHSVETKDNFILTIFRIPYGKMKSEESKSVVLLGHSLGTDASLYVINPPDYGLGFTLADAGYDVWLGSFRGTNYSSVSIKNGQNSRKPLDFDFDEMAKYDMPAIIDYILNVSGAKNIIYISHSMGATIGFAFLAENPKYNNKIKLFFAMAPAMATQSAPSDLLQMVVTFAPLYNYLYYFMGAKELLPNIPLDSWNDDSCTSLICTTALDGLLEQNPLNNLKKSRIPVYMAHYPTGIVSKNFIHFAQMIVSGKFSKYNYYFFNPFIYGTLSPPEYDLTKVKTPIVIFWSRRDSFIHPSTMEYLQNRTKVLASYEVPGFHHFDFVLSYSAKTHVYDKILKFLSNLKS